MIVAVKLIDTRERLGVKSNNSPGVSGEAGLPGKRAVLFRLRSLTAEKMCRWFLAGVMLFGAIPKLFAPAAFAEVIGAYGLLPDFLLPPAAIVLPAIELVCASLLIMEKTSGLWLTAVLMGLFIGVLTYGIHLGLDIDCGCFGPEEIEGKAFSNLRAALVRDLLFSIPLIYCLVQKYIQPSDMKGEKQ